MDAFNLNVDLTGSTISATETGIEFETESSDNTVLNGTILSKDIGVAVKGGSGNQLVNLTISDPGDFGTHGVKIFNGAESLAISGGVIENFDVGIGFETDGFELTLSENAIIQDCRAGIEFLENYLIHVDMTGIAYDVGNPIGNDPVITNCDMAVLFTAGSANNTVSYGSLVDNIDGIVFQACSGDMDGEVPDENRIIGTRIQDNWLSGVSIFDGSGNRFENCLISGSEIGAAFLGGSGNVLSACTVTGNQTGVLIGINSSGNVISSGTVENNTADNFQIDGSNNLIENITLSIGNSLGHISGTGNSLSGISITGDGTGVGLIVPGGDVQLNDVIIENFNVGVGFELDAACLSFSGVSYDYWMRYL